MVNSHQYIARNSTADLLKGIAVLFMIQVHLTELFATQEIYNSFLGKLSLFLGGPPAAPVFLSVMGYYIAKSKKNLSFQIKRGLKLIGLGLLLNIGLNLNLFYKIWEAEIEANPFSYIFGIDILILAGVSIIIIASLKSILNKNYILPLSLATASVLIGMLLNNYNQYDSSFSKYIMAIIGNNVFWSYFPIFPWLAYPLIGYAFYLIEGEKILKIRNSLRTLFLLIWIIFIIFTFSYASNVAHNLILYYHHNIIYFLWIVVFLAGFTLLISIISKLENPFTEYIKWLGENVTPVYVIQWIIIGNVATEVYKTVSLIGLLIWFIIIVILVSALTLAWNKIQEQKVEGIYNEQRKIY